MRTCFILYLLFICSVVRGQAPADTDIFANQPKDKKTRLEVIQLKYADSSMVSNVVSDLGIEGTMKMSTDPRTNSIIVLAEEGAIKKIKDYVRTLDVSGKEKETTLIYPSEFLKYNKEEGDIVKQISNSNEVQVALDKDLGIIMIKGSEDKVKRTVEILDRIEAMSETKNAESRKAKEAQSVERAIRVFWLSNDPAQDSRNQIQPDAALQKSIDKLAALGFTGMTIKMQLLGRCDINQGKAQSRVEGSIASGNTHRTLNAQASLSVASGAPMNGKFRLEAGVSDIKLSPRTGDPTWSDRASVEVDINLEPNKYYILSAAPIGGFQTAFVVQLIEGL